MNWIKSDIEKPELNKVVLGLFYDCNDVDRVLMRVKWDGKDFVDDNQETIMYGDIRYWIHAEIPELPHFEPRIRDGEIYSAYSKKVFI